MAIDVSGLGHLRSVAGKQQKQTTNRTARSSAAVQAGKTDTVAFGTSKAQGETFLSTLGRYAQGAAATAAPPAQRPVLTVAPTMRETYRDAADKVEQGKLLDDGEMAYLQKARPEVYAQAIYVKAQRAEYGEALAACASRVEAGRVHMNKLVACYSEGGPVSSATFARAMEEEFQAYIRAHAPKE